MMSYANALLSAGSCVTLKNALAAIGALASLKVLFKVLRFAYSLIKGHFLPRLVGTNITKHGKWAGKKKLNAYDCLLPVGVNG